jgi:hypothetical protein
MIAEYDRRDIARRYAITSRTEQSPPNSRRAAVETGEQEP